MKRRTKILIIILTLLIVLLGIRLYIDHNLIKTTSYEVCSEKIPKSFDGYKILQISDLHNKNFGTQLFEKVCKEEPDIIVMTGDMVSANSLDFSNFLNFAKRISEKYTVYYIKGNHEGTLEKSDYNVIKDALEVYGITILDNQKVELKIGEDKINLYGMWCNQRYYSRADADKSYTVKQETVTKLLGEADKNEYNVLLMHTPNYFEEYEKWGADLVLSGHVHDGLIRLPFVGGVFSPDRKLFPKYSCGEYEINNSTMIVNTGLSRGTTGFRLFNRPEIVSITLKNSVS